MNTPATLTTTAYTAERLGNARLLVFRADNAPLVSAVGKIRSFLGNSTAPKLTLAPEEFTALRAALAGEDVIVLHL